MRKCKQPPIRYHRVTVNEDSSNAGDEQPNYTSWKSDVHCRVTDVGGFNRFRGLQLEEGTTTVVEFTDNDVSGITPQHQIVFEGRTLHIKHLRLKEYPGFPSDRHAHCSEVQ